MLAAFQNMAEGILTLLGEDAFYDGATAPTKINIEYGVETSGIGGEEAQYKGDLVVSRDIATVLSSQNPRAGKTFVQNGKTYRLEVLVEDNGVTKRFVVMEMP